MKLHKNDVYKYRQLYQQWFDIAEKRKEELDSMVKQIRSLLESQTPIDLEQIEMRFLDDLMRKHGVNESNINTKRFYDNKTFLHIAMTLLANKPQIEHLLIMGADPNIPDQYGKTALHLAVCSSVDVTKILIAYGAKQVKDVYGRTPLECANHLGYLDIAEVLERSTE